MKKREVSLPLLMLFSYLCLVGAVLFLVTAGCRLYQGVTAQRSANEHLRTTLYYLQNQVAANDCAEGVQVRKGPEGDLLALAMPENGCEVYVYTWQGELVEELALTGADPRPGLAEAITPVSSFGLNLNGDTLELEVDGNRAWMSLRSEGEGK